MSTVESKAILGLVTIILALAVALPLLAVMLGMQGGGGATTNTVTVVFTVPMSAEKPGGGVASDTAYSKVVEVLENSRRVLKEVQQLMMVRGHYAVYSMPEHYLLIAPVATVVYSSAGDELLAKSGFEVSRTNVQVEGVDELDIVKNSERIIAVALGSRVYIFDALEKRVASVISFNTSTPIEVRGLYIYGDKLVAVTSSAEVMPIKTGVQMLRAVIMGSSSATAISVFDVSDVSNPKLLLNVSVSGLYLDSRLVGRYAYFVTSMDIYYGEGYEYVLPTVSGRPLSADKVIPVDSTPTTYITVLAMDLESLEHNAVSYMASQSSRIYMSKSNRLYIASPIASIEELYLNAFTKLVELSLEYLPQDVASLAVECLRNGSYSKAYEAVVSYISSLGYDEAKTIIDNVNSKLSELRATDRTHFHVYTVNGINITYAGSFAVNGSLLDQFCMEELNEKHFIVATTFTEYVIAYNVWEYYTPSPPSGDVTITMCSKFRCTTTTIPVGVEHSTKTASLFINYVISSTSTANSVYVIDLEHLEVASKLQDLAEGERIYAARLVKNIFFLVTFRQVDPLYAIDVSDPLNPRVLGYLKIPGFSEYLHPLPEDRLLGIGVENGALKISLFNVSDPTNMSEVSLIKISGAWSQALQDHHAVTVHLGRGLIIIPVFMGYGAKQGFLVVNYTADTLGLDQVIEHQNPLRSVYIGNKLFTVSTTSIKIYDMDSRSLEEEVMLPS